ncbi:glutaminase A [Mycoplasmopsis verecunda]|uniref:Glutaminase n=1 Tax=Mycoplasmopsis verecunda TaxID=171291 RepID=A0A1T4L8X3_9BACT|nr:glutaminase A [Mycoplasmopsis verecunda]WPB54487.1 glutaminase A [Mycoplasmopsis verecunda]SJZ51124.1 L-glutaminase [Mycoplasmopsis verecunda]
MNLELIKTTLQEAYKKHKSDNGGKNASYIPYLANVPSELCGATVVTVNGDVISFGDDNYGFAIESISKVCTLALAMEQTDAHTVRSKIGTSTTGLPFNSVMALELHKDKPLSPLVNAGAMATTSLIQADSKEDRWNKILNFQRKMMSSDVVLSNDVNTSEQNTNFHNRAIAWLLYSAGNMYCDPMEACEVYTQQCSTLVTSKDLAIMASTLANKGINPVTKEQVISSKNVPHILAEMTMEGLYDRSGDFAYMVGLPGKSGVGGGLIAVVPGKLGIAVFSPPLDPYGNSVRGFKIIKEFCNKLKLNLYLDNE